jgi:hypothetical protein
MPDPLMTTPRSMPITARSKVPIPSSTALRGLLSSAAVDPAEYFAPVDQRLFDQAQDGGYVTFGKLKHCNREPIAITLASVGESIEFLDDAVGIVAELAVDPIDDLVGKEILRAGHQCAFTGCVA